MPGRVRWEDLDKAGRAKAAGGARRDIAPSRPPPASRPAAVAATFRCHVCGAASTTQAAAERHADTNRHRRIAIDLGDPR